MHSVLYPLRVMSRLLPLREERRVGLHYLEAVTVLLQRIRSAHPTAGLYEAADLQWWWSQRPRSTDNLPQLFWFDHLGRPEAAMIATDSPLRTQLDPMVMPDATPDWVAHVIERGLAHARESGLEAVGLEVDRADDVLRDVLVGHGFAIEEDGLVETWLAADTRPAISPLHEGYRLSSRLGTMQRPHHMISPERNHPDPEPRLRQTSLYRPDLDLVVHDSRDRRGGVRVVLVRPRDRHGSHRTHAHGRRPSTTRSCPPHPHHRHRPARRGRRRAHQDLLRTGQSGIRKSLPQRRLRTRQADRRSSQARRAEELRNRALGLRGRARRFRRALTSRKTRAA